MFSYVRRLYGSSRISFMLLFVLSAASPAYYAVTKTQRTSENAENFFASRTLICCCRVFFHFFLLFLGLVFLAGTQILCSASTQSFLTPGFLLLSIEGAFNSEIYFASGFDLFSPISSQVYVTRTSFRFYTNTTMRMGIERFPT